MQRAPHMIYVVVSFPGRTKVRLSDYFSERRTGAIEIDIRKAIDVRQAFMNILPRIFFEVQARDVHGHRPPIMRVACFIAVRRHDFQNAVC